MSSLFYLTFSKLKGTVRNQFRSITSGLVTIFMVLLYGAMVVMVFVSSSTYKRQSGLDVRNWNGSAFHADCDVKQQKGLSI